MKTLMDLAKLVEEYEAKLAYGSETSILGSFVYQYDYVSAILDGTTDLDVNQDVTDSYEEYKEAYEKLEEEQENYNKMGSAYHALVENGLDWYVCEMVDGTFELRHATALSSILQCGYDPKDFGIVELHQCWNGEELGECPFDDDAEIV